MTDSRWIRYGSVIALAAFPGFIILYSTGITGVTKKPNHVFFEPGCFCHGDSASAAVTAGFQGPDTVAAGERVTYRFFVTRDSAVAAGFNVASFFGSLGIEDSAGTQLQEPAPGESPELTHILPRSAQGADTVSWLFSYRAPLTAGLVDTLYANGNTVDLNGDPTGDAWAFAPNHLVTVVPVSGTAEPEVAAGFRLRQNYPNPFNPATTITYALATRAFVTLTVHDLAGRTVRLLVEDHREAGEHVLSLDASGLASGVYLYRLLARAEAGSFADLRKMVLLK